MFIEIRVIKDCCKNPVDTYKAVINTNYIDMVRECKNNDIDKNEYLSKCCVISYSEQSGGGYNYIDEDYESLISRLFQHVKRSKEISEKIADFGKFANRNSEDSTGIEAFDFSVRTYNLLRRAGIRTVGDLTKLSFEQVKKIRHLGPKSAEEIFSKLNERGIRLNE